MIKSEWMTKVIALKDLKRIKLFTNINKNDLYNMIRVEFDGLVGEDLRDVIKSIKELVEIGCGIEQCFEIVKHAWGLKEYGKR